MTLWYEYELALDGDESVMTVRWCTSDDPASEPVITDVHRVPLTDRAVMPERVAREFRDRALVIRDLLARWQAIGIAFGAGQNTRTPV